MSTSCRPVAQSTGKPGIPERLILTGTEIAAIATIAGSVFAYYKGFRIGLAGAAVVGGLSYLFGIRGQIADLPSASSTLPITSAAVLQAFTVQPPKSAAVARVSRDQDVSRSLFYEAVNQCAVKPPIALVNNGCDCFLNTLIQMILRDRTLTIALLEEARDKGKTQQIGLFLMRYLEAQLAKNPTPIDGVSQIRATLKECDSRGVDWVSGQHDLSEALQVILCDPQLSERLNTMGYFNSQIVRRTWSSGVNELLMDEVTDVNNVTNIKTLARDEMTSVSSPQGQHWYQSKQTEEGNSGFEFIPIQPGIDQQSLAQTLIQTMNVDNIKGEIAAKYMVRDSSGNSTKQSLTYVGTEKKWVSVPKRLTVVFKRFELDLDSKTLKRIAGPVAVDECVVLSPKAFEDQKERKYQLVGLGMHRGGQSIESGHNYGYVRVFDNESDTGTWYLVNDGICFPIYDCSYAEVLLQNGDTVPLKKDVQNDLFINIGDNWFPLINEKGKPLYFQIGDEKNELPGYREWIMANQSKFGREETAMQQIMRDSANVYTLSYRIIPARQAVPSAQPNPSA